MHSNSRRIVREGYNLVLISQDMGQSSISEFGFPSRTESLTLLKQIDFNNLITVEYGVLNTDEFLFIWSRYLVTEKDH